MTEDDIRRYFAADPAVRIQIASADDGSPPLAWGDTFCFVVDGHGEAKKMPFATLVSKDYPGFDEASQLDRGGRFRLNLDLGKDRFGQLFGFAPREFAAHRDRFDYSQADRLFPHPAYGANGWASVINPGEGTREALTELMAFALRRAKG